MERLDFLQRLENIEKALQKIAGDEIQKTNFPSLVKHLLHSGAIDSQTVDELKKIWGVRNEIYSQPAGDTEVSNEVDDLLTTLSKKLNLD